MTVVRMARPGELPALTYGSDAQTTYLDSLLTAGCTRPEWCLVAERDGRLVGNVVLWTMPGNATPIDFVLFEAPDEVTGARLLDEAAAAARKAGATTQGHALDSPAQAPQFQHDPALRERLLTAAGFGLTRDGCRFRWAADTPVPDQDPRVTWRSLAELGDAPFFALLEDLLSDTRDSLLSASVAELGLRGAAEDLWRESLEFDHVPGWYEIGFDAAGNAVAISLPARNAAYPIIGFAGVSSAHRGRGYATAVVARGTQILAMAGATEIRGDCDASNLGIFKAFQRCGYDNFANRRMFSRSLRLDADSGDV